MGLREEQIRRYSRHILLRGVGGSGQERLLSFGAFISGQGSAAQSAAAYLAAGGSPTRWNAAASAQVVTPGFVPTLTTDGLRALNPDAAAEPTGWGALFEVPRPEARRPLEIALGQQQDRGCLLFHSEGSCAACFDAALVNLRPPPNGAAGLQLGALGAAAYQQLVLGTLSGVGGRCLHEDGTWSVLPLPTCEHGP